MTRIYIIAGAPGSGKTTLIRQLKSKFHCVENDDFIGKGRLAYLDAIAGASRKGGKPVLCDTPNSISELRDPLQRFGFDVQVVYLVESPETTRERYEKREGKPIPPRHLSLIETYRSRGLASGAPTGDCAEILRYLRSV